MVRIHSYFEMFQAYKEHQPAIKAYLKGESIEGFTDTRPLGLSIGLFISLFLVSLALWLWAIVILVKYWRVLPSWAQILGLLGLLGIGIGPVLTIVVVYIGKGAGGAGSPPRATYSNDMFNPNTGRW